MNIRLYKEAMIALARWLERQDDFEPDISAYGKYFLEPPSFEDAIPSIRKFHRLEPFPWPESNCIIFSPVKLSNSEDRGMRFLVRSAPADEIGFLNGYTYQSPVHSPNPQVRAELQKIHRIDAPVPDLDLSDSYLKDHRSGFTQFSENPDFIRSAFVTVGPRWSFTRVPVDLGQQFGYGKTVPSDVDKDSMASQVTTLEQLYNLAPLVSPTGYHVKMRCDDFGPQRFRKSFGGKPIIGIVNYERLFNIYRDSRPEVERTRMMPLHHRRQHPRHLWRKAGLRLEELPRSARERELLVEARHVPMVVVKDCWVGAREFSLDGFDYTVED